MGEPNYSIITEDDAILDEAINSKCDVATVADTPITNTTGMSSNEYMRRIRALLSKRVNATKKKINPIKKKNKRKISKASKHKNRK